MSDLKDITDRQQALAAKLEAAEQGELAAEALSIASDLDDCRAELDELTLPKLGVDDGVLPPLDEVLPELERVPEGETGLELPVGIAVWRDQPAAGPLVELRERTGAQT